MPLNTFSTMNVAMSNNTMEKPSMGLLAEDISTSDFLRLSLCFGELTQELCGCGHATPNNGISFFL